jgi:hypothetical protein
MQDKKEKEKEKKTSINAKFRAKVANERLIEEFARTK